MWTMTVAVGNNVDRLGKGIFGKGKRMNEDYVVHPKKVREAAMTFQITASVFKR